jgi:4-amino-4-deoxy-L-arabinose transferase-like glycosyltransferase
MKSRVLFVIIVLLAGAWLLMGARAPATPARFVEGGDSEQYMRLATQLLQTGSFRTEGDANLDLVRTPGYPLFLALMHLLFGAYKWASLAQTLLALANCLLIYRVIKDLGGEPWVGYLGVLFYLLTPNAAFYPLLIMTETLASFFLMSGLWSLVRFLVVRRIGWLALSGAFMSLAAFVRPSNLILLVVWCLLILALTAYGHKTSVWKVSVWRPVLIFAISGFALILAWQVRNYAVHGRFVFSTVGRGTLKYWIVGRGIAEMKGITREQAEYLIRTAPDPNAFIVQTLRQNLPAYLKFTARGLIRTGMAADYRRWVYDLTGQQIEESGLVSGLTFSVSGFLSRLRAGNVWILLGLYATLLSLLSIALIALTTWRAFTHRQTAPLLFAVVVIALVSILYVSITPLGHGSGRFRVPVEPYIALLSGLAFHKFAEPAESLQND